MFRQVNKQWIISADLTLPLVWLTFSQRILLFKLLSHSVISLESYVCFAERFTSLTSVLQYLLTSSVIFLCNVLETVSLDIAKEVSASLFPATHLSRPQNNTHKGVYKYTPFHVLPKHTLVCSQNPFLVVFRACPKFDTLSGVFCRMMCFVTLLDV